ncbi:hypothetical protein PISMIDRAFT_579143 [Pisolithus microcarpus 441]|uniref:Uncharacterized protein n=1 Tax=Pisolithus microcarpus 441 TaxID=765257 RepID=A0A0C9Y9I8_9AGAM|nr:hypothetical protein PISMIDRAFT_579143 [Pisolithus microcarpus 441]
MCLLDAVCPSMIEESHFVFRPPRTFSPTQQSGRLLSFPSLWFFLCNNSLTNCNCVSRFGTPFHTRRKRPAQNHASISSLTTTLHVKVVNRNEGM